MIKRFLLLSDPAWKTMKKCLVASALAHFSLTLLSIVMAFVFWYLLQPLFGKSVNWNALWFLLASGALAAAVVFALHLWEYNLAYIAGNQASSEERIRTAEHIRKLPLSFFEKKDLTELANHIIHDCSQVEKGFTSLIPQLIGSLVSIILTCVILSAYDWRMSLAIFVTLPVAFGLILATTKLQRTMATKHYDAALKLDASMQEYLEGIKVTKAFGLTGASYRDLEQVCLEMKRINMRTELIAGSLSSVSVIILRFGTPITIFVGLRLMTTGTLDLVSLLFFLLLTTRIYGNLLAPLSMWGDIVFAGVALGRLRNLYGQPAMKGTSKADLNNHEIRFENVSFAYGKEADVIHGVSFCIPQGSVTALVGASGSGKSTVARLAARFWDASSGDIRIGGVVERMLDPELLLSHISYVFQDVTLFHDTIMANIQIGKKDATRDQVLAAAKAANCDGFVSNMPDGYDTVIGENGGTLSGGERQRISIARAMLKNAPVIILDEATAALDPENEVEIQKALSALVKNKTTLVIAHRLRTITDSDQIIVLKDGKIAELGTHETLLKKSGIYYSMYHIQQKNMGWNVPS